MGCFTDFFRLAWGFLYWNARKTVWRLRGMRERCPCQHPSDSGRAWETGCAAAAGWRSPERFRRLCPLLQRNREGRWRCSVSRDEVRPFWGRALAFHGGILLGCYLVATLAAFVFLRSIGYGVTYPGVLWPPAWEKFQGIRASFFLEKYQKSAAAGDMPQAILSLSTAYTLDPSNYGAGMLLARIWQASHPGLADQTYRRLLDDHPAQAADTARIWFRVLLARGDFHSVEQLAAERIVASPEQSPVWLNALVFANLRTGDDTVPLALRDNAAAPGWVRDLLSLHLDLRAVPPDAALPRLVAAAQETTERLPFFLLCQRLIQLGFAREALTLMDNRSGLLSLRDVVPLRLDALATIGWSTTLRSEIESMLIETPAPAVMDLMAAHLIRHPDAGLRALVFERLEQTPLPDSAASMPAWLALFCAAGVGRDQSRLDWSMRHLQTIPGAPLRSLDVIGRALAEAPGSVRIERYLPALSQLSLETTYALFDRFSPPAPR